MPEVFSCFQFFVDLIFCNVFWLKSSNPIFSVVTIKVGNRKSDTNMSYFDEIFSYVNKTRETICFSYGHLMMKETNV